MAKTERIRDTKGAAMSRVAQFLSVQDKGIEAVSEDTLTLLAVALSAKKRHLREILTSLLQKEGDIEEEPEEIEEQESVK